MPILNRADFSLLLPDLWSHWWHLSPLRTLLLQFLNEFVEVVDDFLALGGDDALQVELDALEQSALAVSA